MERSLRIERLAGRAWRGVGETRGRRAPRLSLRIVAVAFGLLVLIASCSDRASPTEPSTAAGGTALPLQRSTDHFLLHYSEATAGLVGAYAEALEGSWARITTDLAASPGRIEGFLYPDQASYTAATGYQATGSVDGPNRFHLLAIPLVPSNAVHEFAHDVMLHLAPTIANNPTWLWESVAIWESGQFVPPSSVPCLATGPFPTLAELNVRSGPCTIYQAGYVLAEFVIRRWGIDGLRRLVLANGDVSAAFGTPVGDFERDWRAFVVSRYL